MNSPIEIRFDFPLADSNVTVSLRASATLHHSDPYYVVENFRFAGSNGSYEPSILPTQEIQKIRRNDTPVWVHKDSQRESQLSIAMGGAIDKEENEG
jgi:hypothetical protein